jgi:hypothetical protein
MRRAAHWLGQLKGLGGGGGVLAHAHRLAYARTHRASANTRLTRAPRPLPSPQVLERVKDPLKTLIARDDPATAYAVRGGFEGWAGDVDPAPRPRPPRTRQQRPAAAFGLPPVPATPFIRADAPSVPSAPGPAPPRARKRPPRPPPSLPPWLPRVQVLCHARLLVGRAPILFEGDYQAFFCRSHDPWWGGG